MKIFFVKTTEKILYNIPWSFFKTTRLQLQRPMMESLRSITDLHSPLSWEGLLTDSELSSSAQVAGNSNFSKRKFNYEMIFLEVAEIAHRVMQGNIDVLSHSLLSVIGNNDSAEHTNSRRNNWRIRLLCFNSTMSAKATDHVRASMWRLHIFKYISLWISSCVRTRQKACESSRSCLALHVSIFKPESRLRICSRPGRSPSAGQRLKDIMEGGDTLDSIFTIWSFLSAVEDLRSEIRTLKQMRNGKVREIIHIP